MAFADTLQKIQNTSGGAYDAAAAQRAMDQAQFGPGSGTSYDPWEQPNEGTIGYGTGANGVLVRFAGGKTPAAGSMGTTSAPAGGGSTGGSYGGFGGVGGSGDMGGYSLPGSTAASQTMRDLQMAGAGGLQSLVGRDTTASRKAIEDALYAGSEQSINTAADRARQAMLEGTFARGVGSSSILTELAGRGQQEQSDALAKARRDAFTQAGSEDRADLASLVNTYGTGFNAATAGLQGEANVALTNLARQQQASQFAQNLGFQGSENAANRAQQASQFGQNLGLQYSQLGQQNSQFNQGLAFQGGQNALNRDLTTSEAALNRGLTTSENAANRDFTGSQAELNRLQQQALQDSSQTFQGGQNDAQRTLAQYLAQSGQTFTGQQNQLTRDQQMQALIMQLANSRDIASGHDLSSGLAATGQGVGTLFGPALANILKQWGSS